MNEEWTRKYLRKVQHIHGHSWQIFHSGQPCHGGDRNIFEVMTSTLPKRTLGSVASLLTATLYQGSPDKNHKLWNIVSLRDIYSIYRRCWNVATYNWKAHNGKIEIISFVAKFLFLTAPHCQFRCVCQGMKQTHLSVVSFISSSTGYIDAMNEISEIKRSG